MEYRHHRDSDTWHWAHDCRHWPTGDFDFEVRYELPTTGQMCEECARRMPEGARRTGRHPIEEPIEA